MDLRLWTSLLLLLTFATACQTVAPLPQVSLSEPGWNLHQGQAVWRSKRGAPDVAGDILVATHPDGRTLVQFTKSPFPLVIAQTTPAAWQIEAPAQSKHHRGRGAPPSWVIWFQLPAVLSGSAAPAGWTWRRADKEWALENSSTGERLEGYFSP